MNIFRTTRARVVALFLGVLAIGAAAYWFVPGAASAVTLLQCKVYGSPTEQAECVFALIKEQLLAKGAGAALSMFIQAGALYPHGLDIDCHNGIHRVGDMMYYNFFVDDPDLANYDFPDESKICNRGFFHGIYEHLVQEHPAPEFIVTQCSKLKGNKNPDIAAVSQTCFHAAGHGLFRAQAERVPRAQWGIPAAFVEPAVEVCKSLKGEGVEERDRYNCTTGVESIFVQTSLLGEYGLTNPNPWNTLSICNQLNPSLHDSCYFVSSLMVVEVDDHYDRLLDDCYFADDKLFEACVRGSIVGLFVNGVDAHSYGNALALCADSRVAEHSLGDVCYGRMISQLAIEYRGSFTIDCTRIPAALQKECRALNT